jgi:uncharacterized membrane protein YeiH
VRVLTAYGGGVLRDLLLRRMPTVLMGMGMLWPGLGVLIHISIVEAIQRSYGTVSPSAIWFLIVPLIAGTNIILGRWRFWNIRKDPGAIQHFA